MGKVFKGLVWVLLGLLAVYLALFTYGRLRGPTPEQAKALALLSEKPVFDPSTDAEAYIWLLEYDVPKELEAQITARDIARYNALEDMQAIIDFKSEAEGRYPRLDMAPKELGEFCHEGADKPCMQQVAEQHEGVKQILAKHAKALEKAQRIRDYRSHYTGFEMHIAGMLPEYQPGQSLLKTHYAVRFLEGDRFGAIDEVCRDLQAWRSIGANSDTLIAALVGQAYARQRLGLLAEMLNASPATQALPDSCHQAIAMGDLQERLICRAMQGEARYTENLDMELFKERPDQNFADQASRRLSPLLFSSELTDRGLSLTRSFPCSEKAREYALSDKAVQSLTDAATAHRCDVVDWTANPMGCVIGQIDPNSSSNYFSQYMDRRLDFAAQLEAARIMLWLREQPSAGADIATRFAARPKDMREFDKRIALSEDAKVIVVRLHAPRKDDEKQGWRLPITAPAAEPTTAR